jgi:hypothetical protein
VIKTMFLMLFRYKKGISKFISLRYREKTYCMYIKKILVKNNCAF